LKYKVEKIEKTCSGFPSQWEVKLRNGKMIYIRYRWGCLEASISGNPTNDEGKSWK